MMTKLFIVDYINLYIVFRVKNINFTQKCNTGGALQKTRISHNFYMSFRVKKIIFYIKKDFRASRCDLVRISLNFSTFNMLMYRGFRTKSREITPFCL